MGNRMPEIEVVILPNGEIVRRTIEGQNKEQNKG